MNKKAFLFLLPVAAMAVVGCSKNKGGGGGGDTGVKVTSIDVSAYDIAVEVEDTIKLNALVAPENATNKAIDWSVDSAKAVIDDDGNITGVTEGDIVVTAAAKDGSGIKKTFNFKVMPKSTLKDVLVAGAALENRAVSSESLTFTGTITALSNKSFYLQDSRHGFYVFNNADVTDLAVGKLATVTSKITKYNGLIETSGTPTVVIGEDGVAPEVLTITSMEQLKNVNQSILCNFTGVMPNDLPDWAKNKSITPTVTVGGEEAIVKFDGYAQTTDQAAVYADAQCKTINFKKGVTTAYDFDGKIAPSQFVTASETVFEVPEIAVTELSIVDAPEKMLVDETIKVVYNVAPVGATTPVEIEVTEGSSCVEVVGKKITGKAGGTVKFRVKAGTIVSPEVTLTVVEATKVQAIDFAQSWTLGSGENVESYSTTWHATQDSKEWTISNMNGGKNDPASRTWGHIRAGHKSTAYVSTIASGLVDTEVSFASIYFSGIATNKINSAKLEISENSDFSSSVEVSFTVAAGNVKINVPTASVKANQYYRIKLDIQALGGSTNGLYHIDNVGLFFLEA